MPLETESSVSIDDEISHETVDSKGGIVHVKIAKELASMVDLIKHKQMKRLQAKNLFKSLAKVRTLEESDRTSKAGKDKDGVDVESMDSLSAGGTWHHKKSSKIRQGKDGADPRCETPPEFIDSEMNINYDDMELGKSIDTADIGHDPNQGYNINNSLDALEEKSSPVKLNLADLKRNHMEYLGDHSATPYGSVDGKRFMQT